MAFRLFGGRRDPFQLRASEAFEKYGEMRARLDKEVGTSVKWEYGGAEDDAVSRGCTIDNHDGTFTVVVERQALYLAGTPRFDKRALISGKDVVLDSIVHNHEIEHVRQYMDARRVDGDPVQAMRLICSKFNTFWYIGDKDGYQANYFHDPTEIRAEGNGIFGGSNQLGLMFPGVSCKDVVMDYVESRCILGYDENGKRIDADYFITLPANWDRSTATVDDVKELFDQAAKDAGSYAPKYNILDSSCNFMVGRCKDDEFCRTVYVPVDGKSPWETPYYMLYNAKDEREALMVVAAVTLMNHPDLYQEYPALEQMRAELDPDRLFGEGFADAVYRYDKARGARPPYLVLREKAEEEQAREGTGNAGRGRPVPDVSGIVSDTAGKTDMQPGE